MTTLSDLLEQRAEAASRLDAIISALGEHYQAYVEATARIEERSGAALQTCLLTPSGGQDENPHRDVSLHSGGHMKHFAVVTFFLLLLAPAASTQDKPNFSGTWVLDVAKTSITPSPELPIEPETLTVTQNEKELRFERRVAGQTTKQTVLFDYPTSRSQGPSGAFEGISASWKHEALVLIGAAETPESQRARRAYKEKFPRIDPLSPSFTPQLKPASILTWALSDEGKTLTVQGLAVRVWTEPTGDKVSEEVRAKWVYRKQ